MRPSRIRSIFRRIPEKFPHPLRRKFRPIKKVEKRERNDNPIAPNLAPFSAPNGANRRRFRIRYRKAEVNFLNFLNLDGKVPQRILKNFANHKVQKANKYCKNSQISHQPRWFKFLTKISFLHLPQSISIYTNLPQSSSLTSLHFHLPQSVSFYLNLPQITSIYLPSNYLDPPLNLINLTT